MIFEHEIPSGSRFYFGRSAKIKREIEQIASEVFDNNEFEEIITPYFSYHQQEALNEKDIIKLTDPQNRNLALRADSSIDVIRLVIKRLKSEAKKWFYIQPVFRYPTSEIYQIGAEWLEGDLKETLEINKQIFSRLNKNYTLQISHIKIPEIVCNLTGLGLEDIKKMRIYKFKEKWLKKLVEVHSKENLKDLSIYPKEIRPFLEEIKELANDKTIVAPLYVTNLRYYTGVFYRFIKENSVYAKGGEYQVEGIRSVGFSIYTDNLIKDMMNG
jgi:histidyl-tRNA synthetase